MQPNLWKRDSFNDVRSQLDTDIITNLISVGDGDAEMAAVHTMAEEFAQPLVKTVKFQHNPTPEDLLDQLEILSQTLKPLVEEGRDVGIGLCRNSSAEFVTFNDFG